MNINLNIVNNFGTEKIELNDTIKNMFKNNDIETEFVIYVLGQILKETYFNKNKPEQHSLRKEFKNDKNMEFYKDGDWHDAPPKVILKEFLKLVDHPIKPYIFETIEKYEDAETDNDPKKSKRATKQRVQFLKNMQPYIICILTMLPSFRHYNTLTSDFDKEEHQWTKEKYVAFMDDIIFKLTQRLKEFKEQT